MHAASASGEALARDLGPELWTSRENITGMQNPMDASTLLLHDVERGVS